MDNTDKIKRIVLINRKRNNLTGETVIKVRPKIDKKQRLILAEGRGNKTIGNILLSRVRPFGFAINTALLRRGYNVTGLTFPSKVAIYYNEFAAGEIGRRKIDVSEFINNVAFKLKPDDNINGDLDESRNRVQFLEITDIADTIISYFKASKFRYESLKIQGLAPAQFMTDEQLIAAKATFIVQSRLTSKLKSDNFVKQGEVINWLKWIVGIAILYYILKNL